jgi:hypothetical protein
MAWCERKRIGYILGLAGNPVLLRRVGDLAEDAAMGRLSGEGDKVRRYGELRYAAKSWKVERRIIARVEAGPQGADSRFIVTNLAGLPKALYEKIYCARGQAENLIKAHKRHLASDRTSCTKATANQFRLLIHTAAYWLMLGLRGLAPQTSFWRDAQFDTIRLCLIKVAGRVTEMVTRIKIALPTAYPYQAGFAMRVNPDKTPSYKAVPVPTECRLSRDPRHSANGTKGPGATFGRSSAYAGKFRATPSIPNANTEAVPRINFLIIATSFLIIATSRVARCLTKRAPKPARPAGRAETLALGVGHRPASPRDDRGPYRSKRESNGPGSTRTISRAQRHLTGE